MFCGSPAPAPRDEAHGLRDTGLTSLVPGPCQHSGIWSGRFPDKASAGGSSAVTFSWLPGTCTRHGSVSAPPSLPTWTGSVSTLRPRPRHSSSASAVFSASALAVADPGCGQAPPSPARPSLRVPFCRHAQPAALHPCCWSVTVTPAPAPAFEPGLAGLEGGS